MGYWRTGTDGKKTLSFRRRGENGADPPPLNPLAPPGDASTGTETRPASFTPMQLGNSSASASDAPSSVDTAGGGNDSGETEIRTIKAQLMAHWLQTKQEERVWTTKGAGEGAFMKLSKGKYACAPDHVENDGSGLYQAITKLNVRVCCIESHFIYAMSIDRLSAL